MFRLGEEQIQAYRRAQRARFLGKLCADLTRAGFPAELDAATGVITARANAGHVTRIERGDDGLPSRIVTPGGAVTLLEHDGEGRLRAMTRPDGVRVDMPRDAAGRLTALGGPQGRAVFRYDARGDLMSVRRPDGGVDELVRGEGGEITATVDANGAITRYLRHADGRLAGMIDPLRRTTRYETTEDGALSEIVHADGTRLTFSSDLESHALQLVTRGGREVDFSLDDRERLAGIFWDDDSSVAFAYDHEGRLLRAEDDAESFVAFQYDDRGHVMAEETARARVAYEYDADGRLVGVATPHGDKITYRYDVDGRLEAVVDWGGQVTSFRRTPAGEVAEVRFSSGPLVRCEPAPNGRPAHVRVTDAEGRAVAEQRNLYDACDRLISTLHEDGERRALLTFEYDLSGRLTSEGDPDRGGVRTRFVYDVSGNLVGEGTIQRHVGQLDELLEVGQSKLDWDEEGNLVRLPTRAGTLDLAFALDGTLSQAEIQGRTVHFTYDALGRRTGIQDGEASVEFGWAGDQLLWEERRVNPSTASTRRDYLYLPGEIVPLAFRESGRTFYMLQDARSAVHQVLEPSGAVVWRGRYDAFGAVTAEGRLRQPFRLAGQYEDEETGLLYNHARYYSPQLRVFLSPDPRWFEPLAQRYAYAANDPYNRIDPSGRTWKFIGAGASLAAQVVSIIAGVMADVDLGGRRGKPVHRQQALSSVMPRKGVPSTGGAAACFPAPLMCPSARAISLDWLQALTSSGDGVGQICLPPVAGSVPVSAAIAPSATAPVSTTAVHGGRGTPTGRPVARRASPLTASGAAEPPHAAVKDNRSTCQSCHALITTQQLKAIFTTASDAKIEEAKNAFNATFEKFSVNGCLRKAHLFAQILTEVGTSMTTHPESLNYSSENLKRKVANEKLKLPPGPFKYFRDNPAEADLYGKNSDHPADKEAIANRAYAGRNGNGNLASGDGWNFRGRGFIQLTGKSNYKAVQREIDAKDPGVGVDIIARSADIETAKGGMISAMGFWSMNNLAKKADVGATDAVVDSIIDVVNRKTDSRPKRKANFKITAVVFGVAECVNSPQPTPSNNRPR